MTEEVQPSTLEVKSPSRIVTRVLSVLEPQEKVAEFKSGDDREESNTISAIVEENKEKGNE